jgi:predicted ATPase/class 3 adenylate cyclase
MMQEPAAPAPSGIVTFVFTDIEGSTRLFHLLGDRYEDLLEHHNELLRSVWTAHHGHEVSTEGDSFFVAFAAAADAIRACAEAQTRLAGQPWSEGVSLRIRIGIHSGLASPRNGQYVALAVHQAARVMSAAHGGQILVSEGAAERVGRLEAMELRLLGRFRLRDFDEPIRLYQVAGGGLGDSFPAVRAVPADGHNIVQPPTSIIGRDQLVVDVAANIASGRVVTLVGPGGVGKTRVAAEIGIRIAPQWDDGVWRVDLGSVTDPGSVAAAIAGAVGAPARPGGERWDDATEHLKDRRAIVILDNCEHLLASCRQAVASLQATCRGVGALATSRQQIGVSGEIAWQVPPLQVATGSPADPAPLLASPAGILFAERAAAARPGFEITGSNAAVVSEICRRLDGLPLSLELAAAMLAVQSPEEILAGLDNPLRLLRSRDSALTDHHRSIEEVLALSDSLLDDDLRIAFRRLSVFSAGFSIESATAAAGRGDIERDDVPRCVWALVDRSLVAADLSANSTRYRMLETTRKYGRRLLDESGETTEVATALATAFLERLGPWYSADTRWVGDVGVELDNLRGLLPVVATDQEDLAQQIACTIGRYHDASQTFGDGIEELGGYLATLAGPSATRVSLLSTLADLRLRTGDVAAAKELVEEAAATRQKYGEPPWDDVGVDRTRGEVARRSGDLAGAVKIAQEVLRRPLSDRGRPRMYNLLGTTSGALGDLETAYDAFTKELELNMAIGYEWATASAHGNLAEVAIRLGDTRGAAEHQAACLELAMSQGSKAMVAFSLIVAARLAGTRGEWAKAGRLHAQGDHLLAETGLVLYEDDKRESDRLLAEAKEHLGDEVYARWVADGRKLEIPAAAELARSVFAEAMRRTSG